MALTKENTIILQKGGFTASQISTISSSIEKAGISQQKATEIVKMLVRDAKFRNDFFEDPLIAIRRSGH